MNPFRVRGPIPGAPAIRTLAPCVLLLGACASGRAGMPPAPPSFVPAASSEAPARPQPPAAQEARPVTPGAAASSAVPGPAAPAPAPEAGPSAPTAAPAVAQPPHRENPPLGWIAGQPLEPEELLVEWGDVSSRELWLVIDKLVAARLAIAEAARLGIRLEPEAVEQRFRAERDKLQKEIARGKKGSESTPGTVEDFIQRELGFEPARYLERVRRATIRQMLAERAVRAGSLAEESIALRLIVVPDGDSVGQVQQGLDAGRDFAALARELSVDDSKASGGLVPFVVSQERSPLARVAFQTPVGEVAGPLPVGDHRFWIKVEERRAPLSGDWAVLESPVEASLTAYPVADAEFVHWKLTMEARYPIDLGPLWSLIGAAR